MFFSPVPSIARWFVRFAAPLRAFAGQSSRHSPAKLQGNVVVERTGMRLLIHDAQFRQQVQNHVRLDFKFSGQLVNANFTHT